MVWVLKGHSRLVRNHHYVKLLSSMLILLDFSSRYRRYGSRPGQRQQTTQCSIRPGGNDLDSLFILDILSDVKGPLLNTIVLGQRDFYAIDHESITHGSIIVFKPSGTILSVR